MATSTIPATIDALITAVRARAELTNAIVHDGSPLTDDGVNYVAIGYTENDGPAVNAQQDPAALGNLRRSETYTIECQACAWDGGTDMKVARDAVFSLFAGVENALRADGTITGRVIFADIGSYSLRQYQTTNGVVALIDFVVTVKITRI